MHRADRGLHCIFGRRPDCHPARSLSHTGNTLLLGPPRTCPPHRRHRCFSLRLGLSQPRSLCSRHCQKSQHSQGRIGHTPCDCRLDDGHAHTSRSRFGPCAAGIAQQGRVCRPRCRSWPCNDPGYTPCKPANSCTTDSAPPLGHHLASRNLVDRLLHCSLCQKKVASICTARCLLQRAP